MGIPTFVGVNDSVGDRGGGDISPLSPEYHSSVYRDPPNTGAVSGSRVVAWKAGGTAVVRSGGY